MQSRHNHDLPINEERPQETSCSKIGHFAHHIAPVLPATSYALKEAANVGAGLLHEPGTSLTTLALGTGAAFTSAFFFTYPTIKENFHDLQVLKNKIPEGWPELTPNKRKAAKWISTPIALINGAFDGANSYLFTSMIPEQWNLNVPKDTNLLISVALTAFSIVNSGATEGFETYKVLRNNILGCQKEPYDSKLSATIAWTVGTPLFLLKSSQDWVSGYYAVKTIFDIQNTWGKISVASISGINMGPGFCFGGLYTINAIDQFIGTIRRRDYTYTSVVAFGIAFGISGWLSWLKRPFNEKVYHEVSSDFSFDDHAYMDDLAYGLSWANTSQETIQWTRAMYPIVYCLLRQAQKSAGHASEKLSPLFSMLKAALTKSSADEEKPLIVATSKKYDGSESLSSEQKNCLSRFFSLFSSKRAPVSQQIQEEKEVASLTA